MPRTPLPLLRELLESDLQEGVPWEPETFAQRVDLACRAEQCPSWRWPLVDTYVAWSRAYRRLSDGVLEQLDWRSLIEDV